MQPFLGSCEVCGKMFRTHRSLAGHLRHNTDPEHAALKGRWQTWRDTYRAVKWCRKCGRTWENKDKTQKDRKRCSRCEELRQSLGKRAYEKLATVPKLVLRLRRSVFPGPEDPLYQEVTTGLLGGERIKALKGRLGVTYKFVRAIGEHAFSVEGYRDLMRRRKAAVGEANLRHSHERYRALSPAEKARLLKKRFGGTCALERGFADQLQERGITPLRMNQWLSVPIDGNRVPREADIKLAVGDGRKIVVLCDGEAFHGPGTIFGDPQIKIETDRQTAFGFFSLGYSVARYSESEVHDGTAVGHLLQMLVQLQSCQKVYRNWCPAEEVIV